MLMASIIDACIKAADRGSRGCTGQQHPSQLRFFSLKALLAH